METAGEATDEVISDRSAQLRSELQDMLCESDDSEDEMDQSVSEQMNCYEVMVAAYEIPWCPTALAAHTRVMVDRKEWFFGIGGPSWRTAGRSSLPRVGVPIKVGMAVMSRRELEKTVSRVCDNFGEDDYHRLLRNCNCFTRDLCAALLGDDRFHMPEFPRWTNRLPRALVGERDSACQRAIDGDTAGVLKCIQADPASAPLVLIYAARYGRTAMVEALCSTGVDVNGKDWWGWSARDYARYWGFTETVEAIIRCRWISAARKLDNSFAVRVASRTIANLPRRNSWITIHQDTPACTTMHNSLCPSPVADTDTELSEWVEVKCA